MDYQFIPARTELPLPFAVADGPRGPRAESRANCVHDHVRDHKKPIVPPIRYRCKAGIGGHDRTAIECVRVRACVRERGREKKQHEINHIDVNPDCDALQMFGNTRISRIMNC